MLDDRFRGNTSGRQAERGTTSIEETGLTDSRSAPSPSARTTRSPSSGAPTRAVRARSPACTVSSGLCTSSVLFARSPTARAFPSALPPPRLSSPSSGWTRTVSRFWSALLRDVRRPSLRKGFFRIGSVFLLQIRVMAWEYMRYSK